VKGNKSHILLHFCVVEELGAGALWLLLLPDGGKRWKTFLLPLFSPPFVTVIFNLLLRRFCVNLFSALRFVEIIFSSDCSFFIAALTDS